MDKPRVLIGTPAYNSMVHSDYLHTVVKLSHLLPTTLITIGNESLITRGRNTIISLYYKYIDNFDYLLFLDADIGMDPRNIVKLLSYNKDVIGVKVRLKHPTKERYNIGEPIEYEDTLAVVERVGTAVLALSSKAVKSLIEVAEKNGDVYKHVDEWHDVQYDSYDVFKVGVKDGIYLSEDYFICETLKELGYKIYVDLSINVVHNGVISLI